MGNPARPVALLALSLAACAYDPWPGSFAGDTSFQARDCATGAYREPFERRTRVVIMRNAEGLFIHDQCVIHLRELSDVAARFVPMECDTTTDDGTPVHIELVSGSALISGDTLEMEYAMDLSSPAYCLHGSYQFVGFRE